MYLVFAVVSTMVFYAVLGVILFGSAGTIAVPMFWVYLTELTALSLLTVGLVYRVSPDLIQERMHPGKGEQDKGGIQKASLLFVLHFGIAGLDVGRYHWAGHIPIGLQIAGLIAMAVGFAIITWAMLVNRYFSSAVRLQEDRGQKVITSGPYQYVRHPGYTGGLLFLLTSGLALGSWVAILPMLLSVPFIVRRTLIEEQMLQQGLPGYTDYMKKVRYRLVPGLW